MRIAVRIFQIIVAALFILSGLVKANDPMGLSYKMQEFFELWNGELANSTFFLKNTLIGLFTFLHQQSLGLSIFMITLEIVAGVALLLGWMKNFVLWLLLLLIVFFTFLTGYAYLSGKFTNCGCFGDCIPITPLTSFMKDLVLLAMILFLLAGKRYLSPLFQKRTNLVLVTASLLLSLFLQWYVLNYLPIADCLPFKKGNNIAEQIKPPPGSITDSFAIRFIYEKGGKQFEFAPENLPADFNTYKFIDRKDKLVRKGNAEPAIKGFSLNGSSGEDSSKIVLEQPVSILVYGLKFNSLNVIQQLNEIIGKAREKNIPVYIASPSREETIGYFLKPGLPDAQFFNTDFTVVRTAARTEPTVFLLKKGVIHDKYSPKTFNHLEKDLASIPL